MGYSKESALRTAASPGYVLVGPSARVYRRLVEGSKDVESVPRYVAATVYELLDDEDLISSGVTEYVNRDDYAGAAEMATALLVSQPNS